MVFKFIKSQLIEVIEWSDDSSNTLAYRFPVENKEIKMGAQLIVAPTQVAIFINEGKIADVFQPGRYALETKNIPILTKLKSWPYGFNSPFKAEVYFINTKQLTNQRWGTTSPINLRDQDFKFIAIRANGTFSYHISEPVKFLETIIGNASTATADNMIEQLRSQILATFSDALGESQTSFMDLAAFTEDISRLVEMNLQEKFMPYGLTLDTFDIQSFNLPKEVQEAINQRSALGALGDTTATYTAIKATDALGEAAKNPGGGLTGMGAQITSGAVLGNLMGQVLSNSQQQTAAEKSPVQEKVATHPCIHCQTENPVGAKFCSECGQAPTPAKVACVSCHVDIPENAKFCPECGTEQLKEIKCHACQATLAPGTKFCSECGAKQ